MGLWKDYLVYAQLYGMAEFSQLAREMGMDTRMLIYTMNWTNSMSTRTFTNTVQKAGSISGTGGGFGGGGR